MSGNRGVHGVLVECYWPDTSEDRITALVTRIRAAASDRGRCTNLVESIVIPADGSVFWLFDGDQDDVRTVALEAGLTFERILASRRIDARQEHREELQ